MEIFGLFDQYIYVEYLIAVIVVTELLKNYVSTTRIHIKWLTLIIAGILSPVEYFVTQMTGASIDWWKVIISFAVSVISYDYVWKVVKDWLAKRSPIQDKTQKAP